MEPLYTTLSEFFLDFLGEYNPITYTVDGNAIIPPGMAGVDWPWVASAVLLLVSFYCLCRLLGGMLWK